MLRGLRSGRRVVGPACVRWSSSAASVSSYRLRTIACCYCRRPQTTAFASSTNRCFYSLRPCQLSSSFGELVVTKASYVGSLAEELACRKTYAPAAGTGECAVQPPRHRKVRLEQSRKLYRLLMYAECACTMFAVGTAAGWRQPSLHCTMDG
ncbi:hypothetical protein COO60DRAFT_657882 [Scenedesmus sp. NREL 46B-D3]|nr:hypothetical protein COO60DRAFT_657882 [Scenedesmus sp. NREL 46B-D3]